MEELAEMEDNEKEEKSNKVYKIYYQVNMLPLIGSYYYKYSNPYTGKKEQHIENE